MMKRTGKQAMRFAFHKGCDGTVSEAARGARQFLKNGTGKLSDGYAGDKKVENMGRERKGGCGKSSPIIERMFALSSDICTPQFLGGNMG
jgi:hypothetical protein